MSETGDLKKSTGIAEDKGRRGCSIGDASLRQRIESFLGNAPDALSFVPEHCLFLLVLWIAWGLRLLLLGDKSIWWDEGWTVWTIRKSPLEIARWTAADTHPPFYFWLLWGWRILVGEGEWLLRFPSAAAGLLTVALVIPLGKKLGGWRTAPWAAIILTVHRFCIRWSQEMRMYAPAALFCLASLWFALLWLEEPGRRRAIPGYVISASLALHTLYLSGMMLLAENLALVGILARRGRLDRILRWLLIQCAVLLPFVVWFIYALGHMKTWSVAEPFSLTGYLRLWITLLTVGASAYIERYVLLVTAWMFLGLTAGFFLLRGRGSREVISWESSVLLSGYLLVPLVAVYLLSIPRGFLYTPRLEARYLLLSVPGFALLLAWAIEVARMPGWRRFILGGLILATAFIMLPDYYRGRYLRDDYISIGTMLNLTRAPDEAVVLHTDRDWPVFAAHYPGRWLGIPNAQPLSQAWLDGYLGPVWERSGGVWLVRNPDSLRADPQGEVVRWLESRGVKAASFRVGVTTLTLYRKPSTPRPSPHPVEKQPKFLHRAGGFLAGVPLRRMHVGDETALLLCGPPRLKGRLFSLLLGDYVWLEGEFTGELGCGLFPLVAPPIPGRHQLSIKLEGDNPVAMGTIALEERPETGLPVPRGLNETPFQWEGGLRLVGYRLDGQAYSPGGKLRLVTLWEAGERQQVRLVLFVHLLGEVYNAQQGNFLWGQRDSEPLVPSTAWIPGRRWVEEWEIPILSSAPPGRYRIELGWYDLSTGRRIPLQAPADHAGADHIILEEIEVHPR